jgi:4-amino-4-deoxy-L-arabinose transferase-like glycosyltransferase
VLILYGYWLASVVGCGYPVASASLFRSELGDQVADICDRTLGRIWSWCQSMRLGVRVLGVWRIGLLGALGALAGALVLVATRRYGINISPDSTYYLAAARGVVRGDGVVGLNGAPLSLFPPALPWVLAGAAAVGDPVTVARWFNAVLFGTSVFGVGLFLAARIRFWLAVGVAAALALSSSLLTVYLWLWSEPVYIAVSLVYLAVLVRIAGAARAGRIAIVVCGVLAGAATLTRYSGISLLPVAAVVLVGRSLPWRKKVGDVLVFGISFACVALPWFVRNAVITGYPVGGRFSNEQSPVQILLEAVKGVIAWVVPDSAPWLVQGLLSVLTAGVIVVVVWAFVRSWSTPSDRRVIVLAVAAISVLSAFTALYLIKVQITLDPLRGRLLAPLLPPALAAVGAGVDLAMDRLRRSAGITLACVAGLVFAGNALFSPPGKVSATYYGHGLNTPKFANAETRELVAALPARSTVFSNLPDRVSYFSDGRPVEEPSLHHHASDIPHDIARLSDALGNGPVYLVWFDGNGDHIPAAALAHNFHLNEERRTNAGVVFSVAKLKNMG